MPEESDYSAANSCISKMGQSCRQKNSSSRYTVWQQRQWHQKVVIRTADLGGEKQAECLELGEDRNPEIGYRGIRVSLDKDEIFKTQLRAILRASAYGNMSVMFPMITDVEEVKQAKLILEKIKNELKDEKIPFNEEIKIGVMIETPAAVMISGELAREADFFSIGTNDLTQLTLGMDRTNSRLERFIIHIIRRFLR